MSLIIGDQDTRTVVVNSTQPLDFDEVKKHKFNVTFDIIDRDTWETMSARWNELSAKQQLIALAVKSGKEPPEMTDDERQEAAEPIYKIAAPFIRAIGPLLSADNTPLEFTEALKEKILSWPWIQQDIADAFMAVQRGMTIGKYKEMRAKN